MLNAKLYHRLHLPISCNNQQFIQALCFKASDIARVKCHWGVLKTTRLAKVKSLAYAPAQHVVQTHILRNNMDISDMMSGDDVHESSFYESWIQLLV